MFRIDPFRFTSIVLVLNEVVPPDVTRGMTLRILTRALIDHYGSHRVYPSHGKSLIYGRFQGDTLTTSDLFVGRDHGYCAGIDNTFM